MRIAYINPNATSSMTEGVVASAREAIPDAEIFGLTNESGPVAIQGKEDGEAAVPGLLSLLPVAEAQGAQAIVIACFDDTGLAEARKKAGCPVFGIGQSSYVMAQLLGLRFSVITSLPVSIPVISDNIHQNGFAGLCASVRASGLPVLSIEEGSPETISRIVDEIHAAQHEDEAACAVLGCAGMSPLKNALAEKSGIRLVDGVSASALLAQAALKALEF